MTALPSSSRSTTMFCMAPPRAVSMARATRSGAFTSPATGPWTPFNTPRSAWSITSFTAREKPSRCRSMSDSRRMRAARAFSSIWAFMWDSLQPSAFFRRFSSSRA